MSFQPEDLTRTTTALFFTRWITHICAPVFFFTAGTGAFFCLRRGQRTTGELSRFLWTRGLWLVVLELTALRFAMNFSLTKGMVMLTILWALGWSMVALGFLVRIPIRVLAPLSIAVIALHNLADSIDGCAVRGLRVDLECSASKRPVHERRDSVSGGISAHPLDFRDVRRLLFRRDRRARPSASPLVDISHRVGSDARVSGDPRRSTLTAILSRGRAIFPA